MMRCADLSDADRFIDQRIGSLNAGMEALQRFLGPLQTRESLPAEIETLQAESDFFQATHGMGS
jgi:hypothetical protein